MKISTEIASISKFVGEEKAIEYCAKAGFDAWDFSMFAMCKFDWEKCVLLKIDHPLAGKGYLEFARNLKRIGIENGIVCNQSHAPVPTYSVQVQSYFKRAIECTAEAGGKLCIIHPDNYKSAEENAEIYRELLPFAKEYGVKIATENMWNWNQKNDIASFAACATPESFNEHLDAVNDEYFTACLDIGHAEMKGNGTNAIEMILSLGKRLSALHIHDNDKWHDFHQLPFSMDIDYYKIIEALKKIDYRGYLTLEANKYLSSYMSENVFEGVKCMANSIRKMANLLENL